MSTQQGTRWAAGNRRIRISPTTHNQTIEGSMFAGRKQIESEVMVDPSVPPVAYARYYEQEQDRTETILTDPTMPVEEMTRIVRDPEAPSWLQAALSENPALPTDLVDALIASPHVLVAITAIHNKNRSRDILTRILNDTAGEFTRQVGIVARQLSVGLAA